MKATPILLTMTLALLATSALAGPVVQRQQQQQARIWQGVRSGELTRPETVRLQRNALQINRTIRRDRIDGGGLSGRERLKIDRMQDAQSRRIFRQKHDRQDRR